MDELLSSFQRAGLFRAGALESFETEIKQVISDYIATNPNLGKSDVVGYVVAHAEPIVDKVIRLFPGWSRHILTTVIEHGESTLVGDLYDVVTAKAE